MARNSEKNKAKLRLKFFRTAKAQPEEQAAEVEKPAGVVDDNATVAKETEARPPEDSKAEPQVAQQEGVTPSRRGMDVNFAPTIAFAIRALVILAIISASAIAAYFLVSNLIGPMMADTRVAEVKKEIEKITAQQGSGVAHREYQGGQKQAESGHKSKDNKSGGHGESAWTDISDLVVNPAETDGTRYVCTTVSLESASPQIAEEIKQRESQIRDALIKILGKRTVTELSSLTVRERIREEIKESVNDLLSGGEVEGVYFSNFVLQ